MDSHIFASFLRLYFKSTISCCWNCSSFGFAGVSDVKEYACNAGDPGLIAGLGRSPREGNGNPLQYSCQENSMDKGAWWATVHGVVQSLTRLKLLSWRRLLSRQALKNSETTLNLAENRDQEDHASGSTKTWGAWHKTTWSHVRGTKWPHVSGGRSSRSRDLTYRGCRES